MKDKIKETLIQKYESEIQVHLLNAQIMIANPVAIQEHQDWLSAIDIEIGKAAEAEHKLEIIKANL